MIKTDRKTVMWGGAVAVLIAIAYTLEMFSGKFPEILSMPQRLTRMGIYTGIIIAWGVSVNRRIIRPHVRRLFTAIACIMVFWIIIRTVKFSLPDTYISASRYLWYFYYIPMLFVPVLGFLISMWLGRSEDYRLPKWTDLLYVIAGLLFLIVLTNDIHQLVFVFPGAAGPMFYSDRSYSYGPLFIPVFAWRIGGLLATVVMIFVKSRVPGSRKRIFLPLIPSVLLICYGIAYILGVDWVVNVLEDVTIMECLLVISILESCLRCGLIQSNTHYAELFEMLSYPAAIVDEDYSPVYTSGSFSPLAKEKMAEAGRNAAELGGGLFLRSMPIRGGHILWTEDASELLELQREAEEAAKQLAEEKDLLQAEIEMKQKQAVLYTRNSIYDSVDREMSSQFAQIEDLVSADYQSEAEKKAALRRMCVIGAYIKRRCNLLFIKEEKASVSSDELVYCMRESADYIGIYGADCALNAGSSGMVDVNTAILVYDVFEKVVETVITSLSAMLINLAVEGDRLRLIIQSECGLDKVELSAERELVMGSGGELESIAEDGVIYTRLSLPSGEAAK